MGIIETIKKIEREEAFEIGMEKGIEKGIEKGKLQVVQNLLDAGKFTASEIAGFAGVTETFVKKVKGKKKQ